MNVIVACHSFIGQLFLPLLGVPLLATVVGLVGCLVFGILVYWDLI